MPPKIDAAVDLERQLTNLIAKKEMYFAKIQRVFDYIKILDTEGVLKTFKAEFHSIERALESLQITVEEINRINLKLEEDYQPNYQVVDMAEQLVGYIQEAHKALEAENIARAGATAKLKPELKLPHIDIIEFHGDKKHWPLFYQVFCSLVHNNKELDDTSKIHYLLGALKGKALDVCSHILPTAANYNILWNILKDRFEDKRLLADTYLSQIMEFKAAHTESSSCLNAFLEKFDTAVNALKHLEVADLSDYMLVFIALSKLDAQTHKFFEMSRTNLHDLPTYKELVTFIKNQTKALGNTAKNLNVSSYAKSSSHGFSKTNNSKTKVTQSFVTNNSKPSLANNNVCPVCSQMHLVSQCSQFLQFSPSDRYKLAREKYWCLKCLSPKHKIMMCKSFKTCDTCRRSHHSLLHFDRASSQLLSSATPSTSQAVTGNLGSDNMVVQKPAAIGTFPPLENVDINAVHNFCSTESGKMSQVSFTTLLSTVVINVISASGEVKQARFLLDSGSQSHIISSKLCQKLRLPIRKGLVSVLGIGACSQPVKGQVDIVFTSRFNLNIKFEMSALVVGKITDRVPTSVVKLDSLNYLNNLNLADDKFYQPGAIDGIIGSELFPHILGNSKVIGPPNMPIAIQTSLGFVVMGKAPVLSNGDETLSFFTTTKADSISKILEKFWELEEVEVPVVLNQEDADCEKMYMSTTRRELDGSYSIALPFKENPPILGNSFDIASKRFYLLEKRMQTNPSFREKYSNVIREYLELGHMTLVEDNCSRDTGYYVPHFAVLKDSVSTPLRIVFDCSAKTSNSRSLNDTLYTGEKLQTDIMAVLLRFRLFEIAMVSDVSRMYRCIGLREQDRRYQRILWRFSPTDRLCTYQLNVLSFGLSSAPFLALRTIKQLTADESAKYPLAARVTQTDIYIDDVITSVSGLESARILYLELVELFKAGGFDLQKWSTNNKVLWQEIPQSKKLAQAVEFSDTSELNESLKVLGLQWNPVIDNFLFKVNVFDRKCTKRNILSTLARIWDPLGFVAPVTLYAKLLIKELWLAKINWDEPPPSHVEKLWIEFCTELPLLKKLQVPRYLGIVENAQVSLVGFSDASNKGLAVMVYVRVVTPQNRIITTLLCAKSKVAPLKTLTTARLELSAAVLLTKLFKFIIDNCSYCISFDNIIACTDSTVVLHWINGSPHRWKTFVANRVAKIQSLTPPVQWYHVDGKNNVADCLSRALTPARFIEYSDTWVKGPVWLLDPIGDWPICKIAEDNYSSPPEESIIVLSTVLVDEDDPLRKLMLRISSWTKLLRITVFVLRFLKILPIRKLIIASDLEKAESVLIHSVQKIYFGNEIKLIEKGKLCSSFLRHLSPFLDQNRLLRVGGRLGKAPILDYDHQHPYLLPRKDHLVEILIDHVHRKNLHTGPHLLLSLLRQKYWILSGRRIVRKRIQMCNYCFRFRPKAIVPSMADLPKPRVSEVKPFFESGVDFAGPLNIRLGHRRGLKTQKAYICLFVCLATKALHLELASDLSTATFINCFKRFLARRGPCSVMHSDCGSNFIGAKSELAEVYKFIQSSDYRETLEYEFDSYKIKWVNIPPRSPHWGGIWESNIKATKAHLNKAIGSQILTYEELATVLVQIEALLNSRPLCWLSSDPAEPLALCPMHFLTMTPLRSLPALDVSNQNPNLLTRKQLLDMIVQSYWKRFRLEYLSTLQSRQKWNTPACPARVGMLVIVREDNTPPLQWPIGFIEELYPGQDGISRVALVKTKSGYYKRPMVRLCPLPNQ